MLKLDLHCHLDGSLPKSCVEQLVGRSVLLEELQIKDDCQSLAEYLERFELPVSCIQSERGLREAAKSFLLSLRNDDIDYVEVRFAPLLSVNSELNTRKVLEAVIAGLEEAKQQTGIYYNVIACAMRHQPIEESLQMFKVCREYLGEGLCAVDLAGDEAAFPMENFMELFKEANKLGLPYTIHAGECGRVKNVELAVECGAKRIGHGIALRGNSKAIQLCRDARVGIEMCPISNMQTKAIPRLEDYPIGEFLRENLLVTVNTDNRTVSNTSITKEMNFLRDNFGITEEIQKKMTENALEVAFANEDIKHELWKKLKGSV